MTYEFLNGQQLLDLCHRHHLSIGEVMKRREMAVFHLTEEAAIERMALSLQVMQQSAARGLERPNRSVGGLVGGEAQRLSLRPYALLGERAQQVAATAMAVGEVNACMGRIVAAPTGGSCGVLPGVLLCQKADTASLIEALFTAAAVGFIVQTNASVAGAQGGCQAEIGTASAMAAAALVELEDGSPQAALHAASITLQNLMGLVCDPIAGLVEVPCVQRNAIGALNALLCADMALCGITSLVPFDQTVEAMYKVGCSLPQSLRESAEGGLADTPAARALEKAIFATDQPILEDLGR